MARRTGVRTLRELAYRGCRLIAQFTPIIEFVFPTNISLILALAALNTACGNFVEEADKVLETGE